MSSPSLTPYLEWIAIWSTLLTLVVYISNFADEYYIKDETKLKFATKIGNWLSKLELNKDDLRDGLSTFFRMSIGLFVWLILFAIAYLAGNYAPSTGLLHIVAVMALVGVLFVGLPVLPLLLIYAVGVFFFFLVGVFFLARGFIAVFFKPAANTNPKKSPFKFLTMLTAIFIGIAKVVYEVIKAL